MENVVGEKVATAYQQHDSVRFSLNGLQGRLKAAEETIKLGPQLPFSVNGIQDLAKRLTVLEERRSRTNDQGSLQDGPAPQIRPSHVPSNDIPMHDSQASHPYPIGGELLAIYDRLELIEKAKGY